jgi:hypothetical protein
MGRVEHDSEAQADDFVAATSLSLFNAASSGPKLLIRIKGDDDGSMLLGKARCALWHLGLEDWLVGLVLIQEYAGFERENGKLSRKDITDVQIFVFLQGWEGHWILYNQTIWIASLMFPLLLRSRTMIFFFSPPIRLYHRPSCPLLFW